MPEVVSNQEILDWVAEDIADPVSLTELALPTGGPTEVFVGERVLDVTVAIGQRLLNLRQEIARQDQPNPNEDTMLKELMGQYDKVLPHEVWQRLVQEDCLEYALADGEKFGIWGGMSERERRHVRRRRALLRLSTEESRN